MTDVPNHALNGLKMKDNGDGTFTLYAILETGDINLGAVELKNDSDDTRAKVGAGVATNGLRTVSASDSPDVVSLAIMDDWDESDRVKANLIVGQAGIAAGAGAVGATVPRVTLGSDDPAVAALGKLASSEYETVAASQTAQALGATGAIGDFIKGALIVPEAAAAGAVTLLDNAISIPLYAGGAVTPLTELKPIWVPLGMVSVSGAWKITTGANVSVIAVGDFT